MRSPFPEDVAFVLRESVAEEEEALTAELLPEERMLLSADASPNRLADFALGRACGRAALKMAGAFAEGHPRPILRKERMPVWPHGFVGSLAHTEGAAAAAVARGTLYQGLGVDIEAIDRDATSVGARILLPDEHTALEGRSDATILLWFCAKEAVYKALNPVTGVYLGFQEVRLHASDSLPKVATGQSGRLEWELLKDSGPGYPAGLRGQAGWTVTGRWIVAGVWLRT